METIKDQDSDENNIQKIPNFSSLIELRNRESISSEKCLSIPRTMSTPSNTSSDENEERESLSTISNESSDEYISENKNKVETVQCTNDFTWMKLPPAAPRKKFTVDTSPPLPLNQSLVRKPFYGSLDRKKHTRHERDFKSKSTQSLLKKPNLTESSNNLIQQPSTNKKQNKLHYQLRPKKYVWDFPPPPPFPPQYYPNHHYYQHQDYEGYSPYYSYGASKEDLRFQEYLRAKEYYHQQQQYFNSTLNGSRDLLNSTPAFNPQSSRCCHFDIPNDKKHQNDDDRIKKLQEEKESLINQLQALTSNFAAQAEKLLDLEKKLTEKTQAINNIEDKLQKEIYMRSSLETQKLELMSTLTEYKLQKVAMEKEVSELRSNSNNNISINTLVPNASSTLIDNTNDKHSNSKTPPPNFRYQIPHNFNSLPRTAFQVSNVMTSSWAHPDQTFDNNANLKQRNVAFADSDKIIENFNDSMTIHQPKSKGLKHFLGKIRRSNSGNLEELFSDGEFRRGGLRATASPRLGWSSYVSKSSKEFKNWNVDDVCIWFEEMGFNCYIEDVRKWLKIGAIELMEASPLDIEKELNLRSLMHRKKILLGISDLSGKEKEELFVNAGKLDNIWVIKWLDDIGLPQLKEIFGQSKIDGRVLHKLTMDDLGMMHINSCLHVASLRRGIQVMRENKWNSDCLIRRSSNGNGDAEFIELWTAHRVMEWLRVVDLAEYAPNLRGAGVHGALMKYEPKFTAELLADLLSIPQSKSLLRRHLATHFKELLGKDVIQSKRDAENVLGYTPLTLTAKIKTPKKNQFSLKRRKSYNKTGEEFSDFVCPFGESGDINKSNNITTPNNSIESMMKQIDLAKNIKSEAACPQVN